MILYRLVRGGSFSGLVFRLVALIFDAAVALILLWATLSLAISSAKMLTGKCGSVYGVEKLVQGNWFCPE